MLDLVLPAKHFQVSRSGLGKDSPGTAKKRWSRHPEKGFPVAAIAETGKHHFNMVHGETFLFALTTITAKPFWGKGFPVSHVVLIVETFP